MMRWQKPLFLTEEMKTEIRRVKRSVRLRKPCHACVILLKPEGGDLMEIVPVCTLYQSYYREENLDVIGVSKTRKEAIALVEEIIMTVFRETGGFDVRSYFRSRNGGQARKCCM